MYYTFNVYYWYDLLFSPSIFILISINDGTILYVFFFWVSFKWLYDYHKHNLSTLNSTKKKEKKPKV